MKHPLDERIQRLPAPCLGAKRLLIIAICISLLVSLATAADLVLRVHHQDDATGACMKAFALSTPALWPAGDPLRHPETVHPGVDLRFSAGLESAR